MFNMRKVEVDIMNIALYTLSIIAVATLLELGAIWLLCYFLYYGFPSVSEIGEAVASFMNNLFDKVFKSGV